MTNVHDPSNDAQNKKIWELTSQQTIIFTKNVVILLSIPIALAILFYGVWNLNTTNEIIEQCQQISDDGVVFDECVKYNTKIGKNTNISDAITLITDISEESETESTTVAIQTYNNSAMKMLVESLHDRQRQKQLKESYNDILRSIYSRDDQSAVKRRVTKRRNFAVADAEKIPNVVNILAKAIVKQFPKDQAKDREMFDDAIKLLVEMAEAKVDSYGDDMKVINLNTNSGSKSTFLTGLLAMRAVNAEKIEVGILLHMEEWNLKKNWKINGKCQDKDGMCWSSVKIEEFLQYQMFNDYMHEIEA